MMLNKYASGFALAIVLFLSGCATAPPKDYSAFKTADPKTILILPPKNSSPDVLGTYGVYAQTQRPIIESGFYVLPISLVNEHFKTNGLTVSDEIHLVDIEKLRTIFGADAALYIDIKNYGAKYYVVGSASIVTAEGRLVDLQTGKELWTGTATASSSEQSQNNNMGLAGLLVTAIVKQVLATASDQSYTIAAVMSQRLLSARSPGSLLYGPRHPAYKK
jgi:hypothetical protein